MTTDETLRATDGLESTAGLPARRGRRLLLGLAALMLAGAGYVLFVPQPQVALGVLTAAQEPDGGQRVSGDVSDQPGLAGHLSSLQSNSSMSTSSSAGRVDDAGAFTRTLVLFNKSDHLLMQRVGLALFETWKNSGRFERVQYVPHGEELHAGERLPDVFAVLELKSLEETAGLLKTDYKAEIVLWFGSEYPHTNMHYLSVETPPVLLFRVHTRLDYQAEETGLVTSGARYTAISAEIAKSLSDSFASQLDNLPQALVPAPAHLTGFYPAYQAPPAFSFLETYSAQERLNGPALLMSTLGVWEFSSEATRDELRAEITASLEAAGWDVPTATRSEPESPNINPFSLSVSHGRESLRVTQWTDHIGQVNLHNLDGSQTYVVRYNRPMETEAVVAELRRLIEADAPEVALATFRRWWYLDQPLVTAYFERHPPQLPQSMQWLADRKVKAGDNEGALALILRAQALDLVYHEGHNKRSLEDLAKEAGLEKLPNLPDVATIESIGLTSLVGKEELPVTLVEGEKTLLWLEGSEAGLAFLVIQPKRSPDGSWMINHTCLTYKDNLSTRSNGGQSFDPEHDRVISFGCPGVSADVTSTDADRIEVTIKKSSRLRLLDH